MIEINEQQRAILQKLMNKETIELALKPTGNTVERSLLIFFDEVIFTFAQKAWEADPSVDFKIGENRSIAELVLFFSFFENTMNEDQIRNALQDEVNDLIDESQEFDLTEDSDDDEQTPTPPSSEEQDMQVDDALTVINQSYLNCKNCDATVQANYIESLNLHLTHTYHLKDKIKYSNPDDNMRLIANAELVIRKLKKCIALANPEMEKLNISLTIISKIRAQAFKEMLNTNKDGKRHNTSLFHRPINLDVDEISIPSKKQLQKK
jgi:hypothetical protein